MLKGTLILVLAYVAAVSAAIIPKIDPNADGTNYEKACGQSIIVQC